LICLGFTESDPPLHNITSAENLKNEAAKLLLESDQDYLRWEFDQLGTEIEKVKRRALNEDLGLPVTVDDVLTVGSLDRILDDVAERIIRAVHRRVGTTQGAADRLGTTRQRLKRNCPDLKH
jgi:hypothetical protein